MCLIWNNFLSVLELRGGETVQFLTPNPVWSESYPNGGKNYLDTVKMEHSWLVHISSVTASHFSNFLKSTTATTRKDYQRNLFVEKYINQMLLI